MGTFRCRRGDVGQSTQSERSRKAASGKDAGGPPSPYHQVKDVPSARISRGLVFAVDLAGDDVRELDIRQRVHLRRQRVRARSSAARRPDFLESPGDI